MPTFTAFTTLAGKAPAEAIGIALERLDPAPTGVGVFEVEDGSGRWEVGAYFLQSPDEIALALLAATFDSKSFVVSELPETDWVAKVRRELIPVRAGRFFVYGSHDSDHVPKDVEPILIEATMAFGTGHHGTTLGCLQALDKLSNLGVKAQNVVDIGCGTAILAMAAARIWPNPVLAIDIDQVAVEVAIENIAANGLNGRVTCLEAAGFAHPKLTATAPFDLIFANILKDPLLSLASDIAEHLNTDGHVILSGLLNEQAHEVIEGYAQEGLTVIQHAEINGWTTLTMLKRPTDPQHLPV